MGIILAVLAALEGLLERLRLVLGRLEGILDRLGGILGLLGASWRRLGGLLAVYTCGNLGTGGNGWQRWWARRGLLSAAPGLVPAHGV